MSHCPAFRSRPLGVDAGRQCGQALGLGLLVLSVLLLAWAGAALTSRMAAAGLRLGQAADAVAYSGALMQARQLNLLAYIQRAQLAHQVAMAHLTTLVAWQQLAETQRRRRLLGNPPAFLIGKLFGPQFGLAYGAGHSGQASGSYSVASLQASLKQHDSVVHQILAQVAQQQWSATLALRNAHMARILQANYRLPDGTDTKVPEMLLLQDTFPGLLTRQSPDHPQGLRRLALAAAGRYPFLRARDMTRTNAWIVQLRCPNRRHQLRRRGRTFLDQQGRWGAHDTLSFHALRSNRWIGCYLREYPMGWAANGARVWRQGRDYVAKPPEDFALLDYWQWFQQQSGLLAGAWRNNPLANSYAQRDAVRPGGRRGLPEGLGLADSKHLEPRATLAVLLRNEAGYSDLGLPPAGWLRQAQQVGFVPGLSKQSSRAAAETYFSAPLEGPKAGRTPVIASLWQPYWQARLIPWPTGSNPQPGGQP